MLTQVMREARISGKEAAELLNVRYGAVMNWMVVGCHGIKLESVKVGHHRFTSREALDRFLQRLNPSEGDDPVAALMQAQKQRRSAILAAKEELLARTRR